MRKMILELQTENAALAHALQIEREWVVSLTRDNGVLLQAADATKAGSLAVSQAGQIEHLERENATLRAQDAYLVSTVDELERENAALRQGIALAVKWAELGLVDYLPEYAREGFLNDWKKLEQLIKESEVLCEQ